MASWDEFYQWLISLFKDGESLDYSGLKDQMEKAGYGDMTAHDVYEAVNTMVDDGDVFSPEQTSVLEAYTGGNNVSQGAYAPYAGSTAVATGGPVPAYAEDPVYHAPAPPAMEPQYGETDLDAAVRQIVYVNNVANNTYIDDNDVFEDNDTVIDSSVNQNIMAYGDVTQDFDTVTATDHSVAAGEEIEDSAIVNGDVHNGIVSGDDTYADGSALGDGNTILNDSDGAVTGDGSAAIYGSDVDAPVAVGGDATQAEQIAGGDAIHNEGGFVETGEGDLIYAPDGVVGTEGADVTGNTGSMYDSNIESGEGDLGAIQHSDVQAAEFGDGDLTNNDSDVDVDDSAGVGVTTGDYSDSDGEFDSDYEYQEVDVDNSAGVGVSDDGDGSGEFDPHIDADLGIDVEQEDTYEDVM
jgi:hypothetical protein